MELIQILWSERDLCGPILAFYEYTVPHQQFT